MKLSSSIKNTGSASVVSTLLLISPTVSAHGVGHDHAQLDSLSGLLHALTTHPLMIGVVVVVFGIAVMIAPLRLNGNQA